MFYKPKVTSLAKHDISSIPFDELHLACLGASKQALDNKRKAIRAAWEINQEKFIQGMVAKLAGDSESTEGLEESVRESMADNGPPSLTPDEVEAIRREVFKAECASFSEKYTLVAHQSWLPAQLVNHFGNWTPVATDKVLPDGRPIYSPRLTLGRNLGSESSSWEWGIYYFAQYSKRGDMLEKQYQDPQSNYCALVPLILSGLRKNKDIMYSQWDREDMLQYMVDENLYKAMLCDVPDDLTPQDLLGVRDHGMQIKSGKNTGGHRNPATTFKLYGVSGSIVGEFPWLAQVMLTQIWCAHPSNRNKYMILDPRNWDEMPEPLVSTNVFKTYMTPTTKVDKYKAYDAFDDNLVPWDL